VLKLLVDEMKKNGVEIRVNSEVKKLLQMAKKLKKLF